ncbi:PREDICTED: uncharacterized aarF domain-containing protein kinase 1-like [Camelina sativa]|uniref:Uncharacterized aarF domain-containing protein kinase 1-like n=1 Tax=Camelina sativa TaxID=90675 RepID=A0ABM1Q8P4_CAMSA|nr:PREDICTED: uncharacterized aarF domain-containing protein kinase 1-like [Camelina sativa]
MAPAAWVKKLVTLCDQAPATPFDAVQLVLEKELGKSIDEIFDTFDEKPLGSASIAQVHRTRVKGKKMNVVVKVQHPGIESNILNSLSRAYGQMILKSGFFHADPHPGNILICKGQEVALLDYGQVKELPDKLRLGYANLVIAMADNNASRVSQSFWISSLVKQLEACLIVITCFTYLA